jgi:hypothetical protein
VLDVTRRVQGEEHPDTLASSYSLAVTLARQAKNTEAEQMLRTTLEASRRVLGSAHPQTRLTEEWLEHVRSSMRAEQPTKKAGKASARRNERASAPALSSTALAEAEARASAAEAELLAMLDLKEPEAAADGRSGSAKSKMGGKAKGKAGKR